MGRGAAVRRWLAVAGFLASLALSAQTFSLPAAARPAQPFVAAGHSLVDRLPPSDGKDHRDFEQRLAAASRSSQPLPPVTRSAAPTTAAKVLSAVASCTQSSRIAAGYSHSLVLKPDGTVWGWGYNADGELGNGTTAAATTPIQVPGLTGVVGVAAGSFHSLALKADGTVWAWGYNVDGEVGSGGTAPAVTSPVQVVGLAGVVAIAGGRYHSLAVRSDGSVWAWGYNSDGQLGNGVTSTSPTPVPTRVPGSNGIVSVAGGGFHSLALRSDGTVWSWGDNFNGQLGDGSTTARLTPVQVAGLTGVGSIAAGGFHSLALVNGGLRAWGSGYYGQLGDGSLYDFYTPNQVQTGIGLTAIAARDFTSAAVATNGQVFIWGYNYFATTGQNWSTPPAVTVAVGRLQVLAIDNADQVWQWGVRTVTQPTQLTFSNFQIKSVAAGEFHSLAVSTDGTVWSWGFNGDGQLGNGSTVGTGSPTHLTSPMMVTSLAAGRYHSLALAYTSGIVLAWGDNLDGELGIGSQTSTSNPTVVMQGDSEVEAGGYHSLVRGNTTLWAFGANAYGELGNGTNTRSTAPTPVSTSFPVTQAAAGDYHSLALTPAASVWSWGLNTDSQLGDGTTTSRTTPVIVSQLTGYAIGVAAGGFHSMALKSDHTVAAWGYNADGELGDGTTTSRSTPVSVSGLTNVSAISGGEAHSLALKADGTVWAWGANDWGQLGNATTTGSNVPVQVTGLTNVVQAVAGGYHSLALKSDGTVWQWGAMFSPVPQSVFSVANLPDAPVSVTAIAGEASATVYWMQGGCGSITGATVTAAPGGKTASVVGRGTSATVTGLADGTAYSFTVTAMNAVGTGPPSAPSNLVTPGRGQYHSLPPARILDTRGAIGGHNSPLGPNAYLNAQITGQGGVPSNGVAAVVLNVTVTDTTGGSYLTVWPTGVPQPLASNLNWTAGKTVPNLVEVAVGLNGMVSAYNAVGSTDVIFDVAGYVATPVEPPSADGLYTPVVPRRVLDTRDGTGGVPARAVGPGGTVSVKMNGQAGLPATGVAAVVLNVTVTGATAPSYLTVWPTGVAQPNASNLNFVAGQTVPNRVIVQVGSSGTPGWVSFFNAAGSVSVIADLAGWFSDGSNVAATGSRFVGVTPVRILDTRDGTGGFSSPVGPGQSIAANVAGSGGVPAMNAAVTPSAVVLNVTVTDTTAPSFVTAWPDGAIQPNASDLNWVAGLTVPNLVVVKLGANGKIGLFNAAGSTNLIIDVVGWYG
jgi:alpha-tubulin suppressor-like RCC1 family protein